MAPTKGESVDDSSLKVGRFIAIFTVILYFTGKLRMFAVYVYIFKARTHIVLPK